METFSCPYRETKHKRMILSAAKKKKKVNKTSKPKRDKIDQY